MSTYASKLKDPRWQKKRLEVLERDSWTCIGCYDTESTLNVHHLRYERGKDPWDYKTNELVTLCQSCHESEHMYQAEAREKLTDAVSKIPFLSGGIEEVAAGFENIKTVHVPEILAAAISYTLSNEDAMKKVCKMYFESLSGGKD